MKITPPPRLGSWLIEQFGTSKEISNLLGDVNELHSRRVNDLGSFKASILYWKDIISLLIHRPYTKSNTSATSPLSMELLKNYFKVAYRNLLRQKLHSGINIAGLTIGFAFSILIFLYVAHELSFDNFHKNKENIYLLPMTWHFNGTAQPTSANCSAGGPFMTEIFPAAEKSVRISIRTLSLFNNGDPFEEKNVYYADSTFFSIFSFQLLQGDSLTALSRPNSIVLTRAMAERYFGSDWESKNIVGKEMVGTNNKSLIITGITENAPSNSHLQFSCLVSFSSLAVSRRAPIWDNSEFYTYVLFNKNADLTSILADIPSELDKKYGQETSEVIALDLIPLSEVYLENPKYKVPNSSNILYVNIFSLAAILIVIIATVNYINMATARSMERALEVGIRKVVGANRSQLFYQFLNESLLVTTISLLFAICLAGVLLPAFNYFTLKHLSLESLITIRNSFIILGGCLTVSLISGIYPALIVSSYTPSKILKDKLRSSSKGIRLRETLVVTQFLISILLIISTLMISNQISFIQEKDLGFDRKKLVAIPLDSIARTNLDALKNALGAETSVENMTAVYQVPTKVTQITALNLKNKTGDDRILMNVMPVDSDLATTLGLSIISGNNFTPGIEKKSETWEILINQSAADFFGWSPEEAIGKELNVWQENGVVKGVVADFHFSSLHNPINPLVIMAGLGAPRYQHLVISVSGSPSDIKGRLSEHWKKINGHSPFELTFLDEQYEKLYQQESQLKNVINAFSILAILISILGLFGLASYSIVQRTKELGIRKVLGATLPNLISLISARFMKLILFAFLLAIPVSWYFMNKWLTGFAYHVPFSWLIVIGSGIATLGMAMITILYHTLEVSRVNPSETLRVQ